MALSIAGLLRIGGGGMSVCSIEAHSRARDGAIRGSGGWSAACNTECITPEDNMSGTLFHPDHWPVDGRGAAAVQLRGGRREGPAICLYDDGSLAWCGTFSGDQPVGLWHFFDERGRVVVKRSYDAQEVRV
jgi:hypothetical protein